MLSGAGILPGNWIQGIVKHSERSNSSDLGRENSNIRCHCSDNDVAGTSTYCVPTTEVIFTLTGIGILTSHHQIRSHGHFNEDMPITNLAVI